LALSSSEVSEKLDTPGIDEKRLINGNPSTEKNKIKYKKEHCFTDDPSSIV
jgi:hypothetical protein